MEKLVTLQLDADAQLGITRLVHAYFDAVDRGDGEALAALFTPDGELSMVRAPGSEGPTGSRTGRPAIAEQTNWLAEQYRLTAHILASHAVEIQDGQFRGRVRCVAHHLSRPDQPPTDRVVYLRYYDDYVKHDGCWLFARRELRIELGAVYQIEPV
jgi:uncharacterized protein (TIGR02246 family)